MSAIAYRDPNRQTITLRASLIFYGQYADDALAEKIVNEILTQYESPTTEVWLGEKPYKVLFEVDYRVVNLEEAWAMAQQNDDFRLNFIRIEAQNHLTRSFMGFGLGDNCGHWIISDQLGESTTAAHEFGHALGLDHPERIDFRGMGNPGIMAPRGTWVDKPLQWNPEVEAGAFGGTLRPVHRRTQAYEVQEIFEQILFDNEGYARIGKISNIIFDEMGYALTWA